MLLDHFSSFRLHYMHKRSLLPEKPTPSTRGFGDENCHLQNPGIPGFLVNKNQALIFSPSDSAKIVMN